MRARRTPHGGPSPGRQTLLPSFLDLPTCRRIGEKQMALRRCSPVLGGAAGSEVRVRLIDGKEPTACGRLSVSLQGSGRCNLWGKQPQTGVPHFLLATWHSLANNFLHAVSGLCRSRSSSIDEPPLPGRGCCPTKCCGSTAHERGAARLQQASSMSTVIGATGLRTCNCAPCRGALHVCPEGLCLQQTHAQR